MATYVLVHGGWHGGWCWKQVAAELRGHGHTVYTPTLSGLAERSHQLRDDISLSTHITDIVDLFRWEEIIDAIVCGHSYGGMVITGALDQLGDRIRHAVYLDAFLPSNGDSLIRLAGWPAPDGPTMPAPPAAFFGLNGALADTVNRLMTAHPSATATQPLARPRPVITPSTYVLATGWEGLPHFTANHAAAHNDTHGGQWRAATIDGSHDLMLDHPADVANLLLSTPDTDGP